MANYTDKNAGDPWLAADGNALADDIGDPTTGHQHDGTAGHATLKPDAIGDGASITWDGRVLFDKGGDLMSGSAITPGTDGNYFDITGTTTITSIATLQAGAVVIFQFDGVLQITHNGTTLILADGANITTEAGDVIAFISDGSGNWRELFRRPVTSVSIAQASQTEAEGETNVDKYVPPDLLRHSPGMAKAWVKWEQTGANSIQASHNMTSVTDGGATGDTDHLWDTDFSVDEYVIIGSAAQMSSTNVVISPIVSTIIGAGVTTITMHVDGTAVDATDNFLAAFGDQ